MISIYDHILLEIDCSPHIGPFRNSQPKERPKTSLVACLRSLFHPKKHSTNLLDIFKERNRCNKFSYFEMLIIQGGKTKIKKQEEKSRKYLKLKNILLQKEQ